MRISKHYALSALAAALIFTSLASARPPESIGDEDTRRELRELREDLARLKRDVDADRREAASQARRLEERLDRLTLAVEKLAGTTPQERRSSGLDPVRRRTGTIRLDNQLGVQARVTVDGLMYTVPPRSIRMLRDQPAGSFSYDVTADGFGQATYRTRLGNNETLTVTIY